MVVFPNCKINLGLHVTKKREDGYHEIASIFYPIAWHDALEIIPTKNESHNIQFTTTGLTIPGNTNSNLCVRAYELLKKDFPQIPSIKMHLHKTIPMGAGLGGGSSDAAAVLQLMNEYFQLNITHQQLQKYALMLGSDCPFFLLNKPALATGRGEILQPIKFSLQQYQFVLLFPSIHISPAWAFQQIIPAIPNLNLLDIVEQDITKWRNNLVNDFEIPVFKQHPDLAKLKEQLYTNGALYAAMSGSGSTLYGIFEKGKVTNLKFPKNITVKII